MNTVGDKLADPPNPPYREFCSRLHKPRALVDSGIRIRIFLWSFALRRMRR
jgi:hypothetical protein